MANERKINGAVSIGNRTYVAGQEKELAAAMQKEKVSADSILTVDPKVLSGDWGQGTKSPADDDSGDDLPTVAELPDHLQTLTTVEEVEAMQARDTRRTAQPHYEARIDELRGA